MLWTIVQVLSVLRGEARSIRIEGIQLEFKGLEFNVDHGDHISWHQAKIHNKNGNWTIRALETEGVLSAFAGRLRASERDRCVFVSQSPAQDLYGLAEKARYADGYSDFKSAIGSTVQEKFAQYHTTLKVDAETAFDWLRRTEFRTLPQTEIESLNAAFLGLSFWNDSDEAMGSIRNYLQRKLNRCLTTEILRTELPSLANLNLKDWNLDPTLSQRLRNETEAYLNTYSPFGAAGTVIIRQQVGEVFDTLIKEDAPQAILLSGVAGSGKSGVVRGVIERLRQAEIPHLALRIDQHLDAKVPSDFGQTLLQRNESPVITLKGMSPGAISVLIIDQIDAVSEVSGRNGAAKGAILRMVEEARYFRSVRVILVCRSFDIESDERIKQLRKDGGVANAEVTLLDWKSDVVPVLQSISVAAEGLDVAQRELLRLPLNLSVFAEIAEQGDAQFSSRNDLFGKLIDLKARRIAASREAVSWSLLEPLSALANWMSKHQRLDASFTVLDNFSRAIDILASENLVVRNRNSINFFHESFFDYVFARSFSLRDQRVIDFLTSSEQHLFRRTQVRQILEFLRQSDRPRYLQELSSIWNVSEVRYHIKFAVAQWLGALSNPTEEEWRIVLAGEDSTVPLSGLVRSAIYGTPGWFDLLEHAGWCSRELESTSEPRRRVVMWWLGAIAPARAASVALLLNNWWGGDAGRGAQLLDWFGTNYRRGLDQALIGLYERVIRSVPAALFNNQAPLRRQLLIARIAAGNGDGSADLILRAYFDAWYDQHPGRHPFERDQWRDGDLYGLGELVKKSPFSFVDGSMPALVRAFDLIASKQSSGTRDYSFSLRISDGHASGPEAYIRLFRDALRSMAAEAPILTRERLDRLNPNVHQAATHLHLETIAANGRDLASNLLPLLGFPHVFDAGWHGAEWKSFADAAKAALPFMDGAGRQAVEAAILAYRPELMDVHEYLKGLRKGDQEENGEVRGRVLKCLSKSGYLQLCILETIGDKILSEGACARLAELRRKFPNQKIQEPSYVEMHAVQSPITKERAEKMNDNQWLSAMEAHNNENGRFYGVGFIIGGARELSHVLQNLAKEQPRRFANLQLRIPDTANSTFIQQILSGLSEAEYVDLEFLSTVIEDAYRRDKHEFRNEIIRIIERNPELGRLDSCWNILTWYITDGDAQGGVGVEVKRNERGSENIDDLINEGGYQYILGLNSARGFALVSLSAILEVVPERNGEAWSIIEGCIGGEINLSVRCCIPRPLMPLFNVDQQRCAILLENLVAGIGTDQNLRIIKTFSKLFFSSERLPMFLRLFSARAGIKYAEWYRQWHNIDTDRIAPLVTYPAKRLLPYIVNQAPEIGRRLLARLFAFGNPTMKLVATWHIVRASFNDVRYMPIADILERTSLETRRLAADLTSKVINRDEYVERSKVKLRSYFCDEDADVRKRASDVFRCIPAARFVSFFDLSKDFVCSLAFRDNSFVFLHALETATCDVSELIILAAEKILLSLKAGEAKAEGYDMGLYQIKDLIKTEYAASEHRPELRHCLLDIIDEMLRLDIAGVEEITKAHER